MFFFEPVRGAIGGRSSLGVLGKRGLGVAVAGESRVFLSFELLMTYVTVGNVGLSHQAQSQVLIRWPIMFSPSSFSITGGIEDLALSLAEPQQDVRVAHA